MIFLGLYKAVQQQLAHDLSVSFALWNWRDNNFLRIYILKNYSCLPHQHPGVLVRYQNVELDLDSEECKFVLKVSDFRFQMRLETMSKCPSSLLASLLQKSVLACTEGTAIRQEDVFRFPTLNWEISEMVLYLDPEDVHGVCCTGAYEED